MRSSTSSGPRDRERHSADFADDLGALFGNLSRGPQFDSLLQRRLWQNPTTRATALRGLPVSRQPPLWDPLPRLTISAPRMAVHPKQPEAVAGLIHCFVAARVAQGGAGR